MGRWRFVIGVIFRRWRRECIRRLRRLDARGIGIDCALGTHRIIHPVVHVRVRRDCLTPDRIR